MRGVDLNQCLVSSSSGELMAEGKRALSQSDLILLSFPSVGNPTVWLVNVESATALCRGCSVSVTQIQMPFGLATRVCPL